MAIGNSLVKRRTIMVGREKRSVSLEDEFYVALKELAVNRGMPIGKLVSLIDSRRVTANLSSALRLFVLQQARDGALSPRQPNPIRSEDAPTGAPQSMPSVS
uniref:ribbon-helix-helix domain-containing protein n=1 Tax=Ancylobacter mangrovi TaxID=2972472 RepID=UPI0035A852C5